MHNLVSNTEELSVKYISIGLVEYNKDFWTLLQNLITWGAAMKLWEAPLSNSTLADTAPNKTYSYCNLWAEVDKTYVAEI